MIAPRSPQPAPNQPALDVTVLSAGEEVGGFGHIFVNGYETSLNQRGYNVVLGLDPTRHSLTFDTHVDATATENLGIFLNQLPADTLVAVAAADEASLSLTPETVAALQDNLGVTGNLQGCFRCSHAIIRTANGQTIEALDPLHPVGVTTGLGLTEPTVTALVQWIRVEVEQ